MSSVITGNQYTDTMSSDTPASSKNSIICTARNISAMESTNRNELNERFASAVELLIAHVYSELLAEWQQHAITVLQARLLEALLQIGPARMTDLALHLGHNLSTTAGLADRLAEKGLIRQYSHANDRRIVTCDLTKTGAKVAKRTRRRTDEAMAKIAQHASLDEMSAIVQSMEELIQRVKATE